MNAVLGVLQAVLSATTARGRRSKAVLAGLLAAVSALGSVATKGVPSWPYWVVAVAAGVVAGIGVYWVPNRTTPVRPAAAALSKPAGQGWRIAGYLHGDRRAPGGDLADSK